MVTWLLLNMSWTLRGLIGSAPALSASFLGFGIFRAQQHTMFLTHLPLTNLRHAVHTGIHGKQTCSLTLDILIHSWRWILFKVVEEQSQKSLSYSDIQASM